MKPEIEITRTFDADIESVWRAITEKELMKQWFFELTEFKAEVGFTFSFAGGHEVGIQYKHLCEVTEVIKNRKLTYSWKYEGYEGISFVTFELSEEDGKTKLTFYHSGLSSFSNKNPDFGLHNFKEGWNHFINQSLPSFLNKIHVN